MSKYLFNPSSDTGLFLYPLKTSENFWFSAFIEYRTRPVAWNGLNSTTNTLYTSICPGVSDLAIPNIGQSIEEWTKWNLWKTAFKTACLSKRYHFKFFKGYLPQISLGPFFNTLSHVLGLVVWVLSNICETFRINLLFYEVFK